MIAKAALSYLSHSRLIRKIYAALGAVPVLGPALRRLVRSVFPADTRVWLKISAGPGKGLWANLDPRFEMDYANGHYELKIQRVLVSYLPSGSIFYDVGAHIGILSMFAARLVGASGIVFAFEADPGNVARIEEHARRNKLGQVHAVASAVWSSAGRLQFERASRESSRNQGALADRPGSRVGDTIDVDTIPLDDFCRLHSPPTLIKIDVEGAEAEVLRGCEEVFDRAKPVLVCEVHGERQEREVIGWLRKKHYIVAWLDDTGRFPRHLLAKYNE